MMINSADGGLVKEYATNFPGGVWPEWLELRQDGAWAGSTTTAASRPGGGVDLIAATGASKNAGVYVNLNPDLGSGDIARLDLQFIMSGGGNSNVGVMAGLVSSGLARGAAVIRPAGALNSTPTYMRTYGAATTDNVITQLWENSAQRYTFGITITKKTVDGVNMRFVEFTKDGEHVDERPFTVTDIPSGTVRAEIAALGASGGPGGTVHTLHAVIYREHYAA